MAPGERTGGRGNSLSPSHSSRSEDVSRSLFDAWQIRRNIVRVRKTIEGIKTFVMWAPNTAWLNTGRKGKREPPSVSVLTIFTPPWSSQEHKTETQLTFPTDSSTREHSIFYKKKQKETRWLNDFSLMGIKSDFPIFDCFKFDSNDFQHSSLLLVHSLNESFLDMFTWIKTVLR